MPKMPQRTEFSLNTDVAIYVAIFNVDIFSRFKYLLWTFSPCYQEM